MIDKQLKPTEEQINRLKPDPVDGLPSLDDEGIANYIKTNHCKNIVFIIGAGISCAAGIPDFRTPGTGLYYNLQKFNLPRPESIFTLSYFKENPKPFFELSKEMLPGKYKPTYAHYLPVILHRHNLLLRVYTQNIDGLERIAGLPTDKVIECHGNYYSAHCMKCNAQYELNEIRSEIIKGDIPLCPKCKEGVIKPDIVLFGEELPEKFYQNIQNDFNQCDLLILIGTSLKVAPVNILPSIPQPDVPRLMINREMVQTYQESLIIQKSQDGKEELKEILPKMPEDDFYFKFGHALNRRDVFMGGDCQKSVQKLIDLLGWKDEYDSIVPEDALNKLND